MGLGKGRKRGSYKTDIEDHMTCLVPEELHARLALEEGGVVDMGACRDFSWVPCLEDVVWVC